MCHDYDRRIGSRNSRAAGAKEQLPMILVAGLLGGGYSRVGSQSLPLRALVLAASAALPMVGACQQTSNAEPPLAALKAK